MALWSVDWIFGATLYLGTVGEYLHLASYAAFFYFVVASRIANIPRWIHTWGWMSAVLVVTIIRAWIGGDRLLLDGASLWFETLPESMSPQWQESVALVRTMLLGQASGVLGGGDALIVVLGCWLGDRLREDRKQARVPLLPRLVVLLLQMPILFIVLTLGLAGIGGQVALWTRHVADQNTSYASGFFLAVSFGIWALGVFHYMGLRALARGRLPVRLMLGLVAALSAALVVSIDGGWIATIAWFLVQIAALVWARPTARVSSGVTGAFQAGSASSSNAI